MISFSRSWSESSAVALFAVVLCGGSISGSAQQLRSLGIDVSTYQGNITAANWATLKRATNSQVGGVFGDGRDFVMIRATRGGTTGEDHRQGGYPSGNNTLYYASERYDDPYYVQNINLATAAGLFAGSYHFARPDVVVGTVNSDGTTNMVANTGTDEANHMLQMAANWMRPGYLPPVLDFEAGDGIRTDNQMAQFCIAFSDQIFAVMGIRPAIYINGNYAANILQTATTPTPAQVVAAMPTLWSARWPNQTNVPSIDVQNGNPKDSYTPIYGPWDDAPNPTHPWKFWQYASTGRVNAIGNGGSNCDVDVAHGGPEYIKDILIPAMWVTNVSGQWTTLSNWNSGQAPVTLVSASGQLSPIGTQTLPTSRLPGTNDTVILDVTNTAVTVTLSSGTHNIRKLYTRETLNISGGSLTINYAPSWDSTPISAQFSGPVTLNTGASLSVHTLQVDNAQMFTVNGGTLAFNAINLMNLAGAPAAKLAISGDATYDAVAGPVVTITNGGGAGNAPLIDLGTGVRAFNFASGLDLTVAVTVTNGGITKTGTGTMRLTTNNTYYLNTTIGGGTLWLGSGGSISNTPLITISNGATFDVSSKAGGFTLRPTQTLAGKGSIIGKVIAQGTVLPGASPGRLTFSTNLTLAGTTVMEVSHNGSAITNDSIVCNGTLTYGGTLTVTNIGPALVGGEVFTNFSATTYAGTFSSTNLPSLAAGLNWYLGRISSEGAMRVNRRPVPGSPAFTNGPSRQIQIPLASLTAGTSDPDGDGISLVGVNLTTTNGVTLVTNSVFITYSNSANVADSFTFTIGDAYGGFATGTASIAPAPITPPAQFNAAPTVNGSSVTLHVSGGAGSTYYLERSTNLPAWITISTNVMPGNGLLDYVDDFHDLTGPPSSAFYRVRWSP
jgi:autotransporter-associated beta strand protein